MKTIKTLAAALLAGGMTAAMGIGQPAYAQPAAQTVAIHYGDLDLGSRQGRGTLDQRIRQAIRTVCGTASPADLRGLNAAADCRADLSRGLARQRDAAFAAAARRGAPATLVIRR